MNSSYNSSAKVIEICVSTKKLSITMNKPMDVTGQTYGYYCTMEFLPPMIFFVLCMVASLLLIPVQFLLKQSPKLKRYLKTQFLIKQVFSIMLNKQTDRNGKQISTILNYQVSDRYKVMMLGIAICLLGVGGVSFWNTYLFEGSYICNTDPELACFPSFSNKTTLRLDCSDTSYLRDNNITSIICYRFVYRLDSATGAALGIIAFDALFVIIITLLLLKVSNGSEWTKCRAALTVATQITIVTMLPVAMATIYHIIPFPASTTIEKQMIKYMAKGALTYTILYNTVLFPWWSFKKIKDEDNNDREDGKENNEENNGGYRRVKGTLILI